MTALPTERLDRVLERLYRRHADEVFRYAVTVVRNHSDAEDVMQQTFLNAYRALLRGEVPRAPGNWLIAIAHNVCRERVRRSARRPLEVELNEGVSDAASGEERWNAQEIRRALSHLGPNQRAAIVLRELEGRSYAEIAQALGLSLPAVEALVFRARRALREQLEGGLSCSDAEAAIARQLDQTLARSDRSALRAHLRECRACAGLARRRRGRRRLELGAIPFPLPLKSFLAGEAASTGAASVGGGVAAKAAALAAAGMVATGVGFDGIRHAVERVTDTATPPAKAAPRGQADGSLEERAETPGGAAASDLRARSSTRGGVYFSSPARDGEEPWLIVGYQPPAEAFRREYEDEGSHPQAPIPPEDSAPAPLVTESEPEPEGGLADAAPEPTPAKPEPEAGDPEAEAADPEPQREPSAPTAPPAPPPPTAPPPASPPPPPPPAAPPPSPAQPPGAAPSPQPPAPSPRPPAPSPRPPAASLPSPGPPAASPDADAPDVRPPAAVPGSVAAPSPNADPPKPPKADKPEKSQKPDGSAPGPPAAAPGPPAGPPGQGSPPDADDGSTIDR